jgi:hypothetical protein
MYIHIFFQLYQACSNIIKSKKIQPYAYDKNFYNLQTMAYSHNCKQPLCLFKFRIDLDVNKSGKEINQYR